MPNIGAVLKEEIIRLSRKETRGQSASIRKASAQYRRDIAKLRGQVADLERQVAMLSRQLKRLVPAPAPEEEKARLRFTAKGLRAQRNRLGLSAADFGKLLGVSGQSIYNWEHELARPRDEQIAKLAAVRGIGKREAATRLEGASAKSAGAVAKA